MEIDTVFPVMRDKGTNSAHELPFESEENTLLAPYIDNTNEKLKNFDAACHSPLQLPVASLILAY